MSDDSSRLTRRTALKGLGGAAGTALVGGTGLAAFAGGASATAGGTIDDPDVAVSDDGEIQYVAVQSTGRLNWDGFDQPARKARLISRVTVNASDGNGPETYEIHDTGKFDLAQESWGGDGEEISLVGDHEDGQAGYIASDVDWGIIQANSENTYNSGYGLPTDPAPASRLYADADGSQKTTTVTLKSLYILYNENGAELTGTDGYPDRPTFSASFDVTVKNEKATTSGGDSDAQGDTDDTAEVGV